MPWSCPLIDFCGSKLLAELYYSWGSRDDSATARLRLLDASGIFVPTSTTELGQFYAPFKAEDGYYVYNADHRVFVPIPFMGDDLVAYLPTIMDAVAIPTNLNICETPELTIELLQPAGCPQALLEGITAPRIVLFRFACRFKSVNRPPIGTIDLRSDGARDTLVASYGAKVGSYFTLMNRALTKNNDVVAMYLIDLAR